MKSTIGVFAHVDAGKTTFCEALLYTTGRVQTPGRVDFQSALLDYNRVEKQRGITVFSDMAHFCYEGKHFQLIDTPGHTDFAGEMEQTLPVLDAAILLLNGTNGVQSHTLTLYRLLNEHAIPVYFFINKMDLDTADLAKSLDSIKKQLTPHVFFLSSPNALQSKEFTEWLCDYNDELFAAYLEDRADFSLVLKVAEQQIRQGNLSLVMAGSALQQQGVSQLLKVLALTQSEQAGNPSKPFAGLVYKVGFDAQGNRVTFLKCVDGSLQVKDEIAVGDATEKVHEIRQYFGKDYVSLRAALAGDIVGVTGVSLATPGMGIGASNTQHSPALLPTLRVAVLSEAPHVVLRQCLAKIEAQMPLLAPEFQQSTQQFTVYVMGTVQLEILQAIFREDYQLQVEFGEYQVVYQETIAAPCMGYGHFEPLRHYAEVHLKMEPSRGKGLSFSSAVSTDILPQQSQNLIENSIFSKEHKGVLTGSPITNIHFTLTAGAVHLKHTSGGDLREATWRAIRQGLEQADSLLLEPWYQFEITVPTEMLGRVLSDIARLNGTFQSPESTEAFSTVRGKGSVRAFLEYPQELLAFTKGLGVITLTFFDYLPANHPEQIIQDIGYEKERDLDNPSSSVFCAKGAGFEVKWDEVEAYLHL